MLPHVCTEGPGLEVVVALLENRLANAPPHVTEDLSTALTLLASRTAGLLVTGRPAAFPDLAPEAARKALTSWGASRIPQARTIHQALRKVILSTWYATGDGRREIGVRPPLHTRLPAVAWEGALPGAHTLDSEPVARSPVRATPATPSAADVPLGVIQPESIAGERTLTADVVIVGSGAGGAVAAARFAAAGREVVLLEAGEYLHTPDFTEDEGALSPRLLADRAMRSTSDASMMLLQGSAAGGGTTVNWMLMLRPPAHVLQEWSDRLRISGFSETDLAPHLDRVGEEVHARLPPDDAHSPSNRAILEGARSLGWRSGSAMINAKGCVQAGTCSLGCRYEAKQGGLLTYLPAALTAGTRLFTGAEVDRIEAVDRQAGSGTPSLKRVVATVRDGNGLVRGRLSIRAPIVVLAAGAVGTPVILQRSGLGGGGVGRFLRLHPTTAVMGHYPRETYPLAGIPQTALCDEFIRRDANGYGFWIECPALQPGLAAAALPGFGEAHHQLQRQLANTIAFIVLVRDGSGSDASSGSVLTDRRGRTRIRYRMSAADRENLRVGIEAAARMHLAAGATEALSLHTPMHKASDERGLAAMRAASVSPNRVTLFSAHVNGTCRLGVDPATSGCSPTGERHGVRGLYVMDGSLLPTAPGVNPQWTIMALASLLAERAIA